MSHSVSLSHNVALPGREVLVSRRYSNNHHLIQYGTATNIYVSIYLSIYISTYLSIDTYIHVHIHHHHPQQQQHLPRLEARVAFNEQMPDAAPEQQVVLLVQVEKL